MREIKNKERCVYYESNPEFNLITFDDNREMIKIPKNEKNFCWFFKKTCGDLNFDCKPKFRQCKKCGSSKVKYKDTLTPAFDEIGDKFVCEDCGEETYRWF